MASPELRKDPVFVLKAIKINSSVLESLNILNKKNGNGCRSTKW